MCTGSLDTAFIFEAFNRGADGVFVGGCKMGECHYSTGNYHAKEKVEIAWEMLKKAGFDHERLGQGWGSRLYEALFARLREGSTHVAIAGIALPNPESIALHEKFGMQKVAHFAEVGFKFERWIDVGYWQVILDG